MIFKHLGLRHNMKKHFINIDTVQSSQSDSDSDFNSSMSDSEQSLGSLSSEDSTASLSSQDSFASNLNETLPKFEPMQTRSMSHYRQSRILQEENIDVNLLCSCCVDRELNKIALICKRWKTLVDNHHLFSKLSFFDQNQNKKDYEHLLLSDKRYHSLSFSFQGNAKMQLDYLEEFLKNQRQLEKVKITLERALVVEAADLMRLLKMFEDVETLIINVGATPVINKTENMIVNFKKLKYLTIRGFTEIHADLSSFIAAPNLEYLNFYITGAIHAEELFTKWRDLMPFILQLSEKLKSINIFSKHESPLDQFLHWHSDVLLIRNWVGNCDELHQFLTGKVQDINTLYVENCSNVKLIDYIMKTATKLEKIYADEDFLKRLGQHIRLPSVKKLFVSDTEIYPELRDLVITKFPFAEVE